MSRLVRIFAFIAAISGSYGQTAQLSGVVRDPSKAVVGSVSVAVRNDETQVERGAVTNSDGVYVIIQASGFRSLRQTNVKLDVAQTAAPGDGTAGSGQITTASASVTIGGVDASVCFSGLAPGFVGLYQVNAEVPAGLTPGNQPVILSIGANSSNSVLLPVT